MPFAKFWCEQTAANVWIAELEISFPTSRFEALRAETYDEIMAKVDESYRRLTGPSEKEKRKALEAAAMQPGGIVWVAAGDPIPQPAPAAEPTDAPNAPAAPEAAEAATDHRADTAAVLPSEVEHVGREAMGEAKQRAEAFYEGAQNALNTSVAAEAPVRQKRRYRKRGSAV